MEELRTGLDSALISKLSDFFWQELKLVFEPWVVLVLWFHLLQLVGNSAWIYTSFYPGKSLGLKRTQVDGNPRFRWPGSACQASRTFTSAERAHMDGTCQPCVLFASAGGCHKGEACRYCHLPHLPEARATTRGVRKHTRDSIKERVSWLFLNVFFSWLLNL